MLGCVSLQLFWMQVQSVDTCLVSTDAITALPQQALPSTTLSIHEMLLKWTQIREGPIDVAGVLLSGYRMSIVIWFALNQSKIIKPAQFPVTHHFFLQFTAKIYIYTESKYFLKVKHI